MIKEAIEDYGRYKQDEINNNQLILKYEEGGWKKTKCWTLMPGDIIKVSKNQPLTPIFLKSNYISGNFPNNFRLYVRFLGFS